MKVLSWSIGFISTFAVIIVLLITSVELSVYGDKGFFRNEYEKYGVANTVEMNMEDLIYVTDEMMAYLADQRENLDIVTTIGGIEKEFFNEKEKKHMSDVKELFLIGRYLRRGAVVLFIVVVMILLSFKKIYLVAQCFNIGSMVFVIIASVLTAIIANDFSKYFTIFHELFFTNDLWLLDPKTDLLINIVPEPFFISVAIRIVVIFVISLAVIFGISSMYLKKRKNALENCRNVV